MQTLDKRHEFFLRIAEKKDAAEDAISRDNHLKSTFLLSDPDCEMDLLNTNGRQVASKCLEIQGKLLGTEVYRDEAVQDEAYRQKKTRLVNYGGDMVRGGCRTSFSLRHFLFRTNTIG